MSVDSSQTTSTTSKQNYNFHPVSAQADQGSPIPGTPPSVHSRLALFAARQPQHYVNSFCGAVAGAASGVVTCPLDVIKTKLQGQGGYRPRNGSSVPATSKPAYSGMFGTASVIWRQDGLRGMYRGLGPMLLGYLPTWAVYMTVYGASRDYYYTQIGELLQEHLRLNDQANSRRQQVARTIMCFYYCGCKLNSYHESYLGYQNKVDVSSWCNGIKRYKNTLALP